MDAENKNVRMLLIDTCGDAAMVALSEGDAVVGAREMVGRSASARMLSEVREILGEVGWKLGEVDGVGVVNGPGSFTGMRTGLAAAKGLCEATGLRLAVASRLEVLAEAAELRDGFAVLNAGRDELYVREMRGDELVSERLVGVEDFLLSAVGDLVVIAEERLVERLVGLQPRLRVLGIEDALGPLLRSWKDGGVDAAVVDANYVRGEEQIYRKSEPAARVGA